MHVDGKAVKSCVTAMKDMAGHTVTTIEGLSPDGNHPVQKAWRAEERSACGYCQPGQIMAAAALIAENSKPSDEQILSAMSGKPSLSLRLLSAHFCGRQDSSREGGVT